MATPTQVIIVGGGLAGLSAAHTVLEGGGRVLLIDKVRGAARRRRGGRAARVSTPLTLGASLAHAQPRTALVWLGKTRGRGWRRC